jgi:nucleoside-diphosphate-sugar epimerase
MVSDVGAHFVAGDLQDRFSLNVALKASKPDIVLHYGALTSVGQSFYMPEAFCKTNYLGTINLINAVRDYGHIERLYYIATTESLKSREKPHSEFNYEYSANSPYGISKLASELYCQHACKAFGVPITIIRYNNTFHRKTSKHFLTETIITQLLKGPKVVLKGTTKIKRTWTIIDDVVDGTLKLLKNSREGELYHIVNPENQATIGELINITAKILGYENVEVVEGVEPRPWDPLCLCLTSERFSEIGWKPKYPLEEALKMVARYWKDKI